MFLSPRYGCTLRASSTRDIITMAGITRFGFLAMAVAFHLVYILSIFDIYFVSPIVSGMRLFKVEREEGATAPADRLVLFVGKQLLSRVHVLIPRRRCPCLLNVYSFQAMDCGPTRHSNPSPIPIPSRTMISHRDPSPRFSDRGSSNMEHSESPTPECRPNPGLATWLSSPGCTKMCRRLRRVGS